MTNLQSLKNEMRAPKANNKSTFIPYAEGMATEEKVKIYEKSSL